MNAAVAALVCLFAIGAAGGGLDGNAGTPATGTAGEPYTTLASLVNEMDIPSGDKPEMIATAMGESNGELGAVSPPNNDGTRDRCAWQINDVHHFDHTRLVTDWHYCANAAERVYHEQGLSAWSVYDNGRYLRFMPQARAALGE
jgi:hypothetical protein